MRRRKKPENVFRSYIYLHTNMYLSTWCSLRFIHTTSSYKNAPRTHTRSLKRNRNRAVQLQQADFDAQRNKFASV